MKRFALFVTVGGLSTLLQFVLLIIFVETGLLPEVGASAAGYLLSALFNYWANYHYTFNSTNKHAESFPKYVVTVAIGLSSNTLLFALTLFFLDKLLAGQYFDFPWLENYVIAQFFATAITLCLNFAAHHYWIYRNP